MHTGLDYPASRRHAASPPRAAAACARPGYDSGGYGKLVVIEHRAGMTSYYAHLRSIAVVARDSAWSPGTSIGSVGSTGNSTGPHLHFELRLNGAADRPALRSLARRSR